MIPVPLGYQPASSLEHALELVAEHGDEAKMMAGGRSLIPLLCFRLAAPAFVIDIGALRELSYIQDAGEHIGIGALTRHSELERSDPLHTESPLVAFFAGQIGDPQVRHQGTIGDSLSHADPAADLPAAVLALDAQLVATSANGSRVIEAKNFFSGFMETALLPDEIVTEVRVPKMPGVGWGFQKLARRAQDFAIVGAIALASDDHRIALINMGSTLVRCTAIQGALMRGADVATAATLADKGTEPLRNTRASAEYKADWPESWFVGRSNKQPAPHRVTDWDAGSVNPTCQLTPHRRRKESRSWKPQYWKVTDNLSPSAT